MTARAASLASTIGFAILFLIVALSVPAARAAQSEGVPRTGNEASQDVVSVLPSGEIPALRSRTSRTFLEERGTYRLEEFAGTINFQNEAGAWQPIDNSLIPALAPGYALRNKANRYALQLPASLALAPVRISEQDRWLSFSLEGAEGLLQQQGNRARYREALPRVHVDYEARADMVKETLVLESAAAQSSFRFELGASAGLSATLERRAVVFRDGAGEAAFTLTPPFMVDAAGERSERVDFSIEPSGQGWALTLDVDRAWLSAPERRFPVAIDPTTFLGPWAGTTPFVALGSDCSLKSGQSQTAFCSELQLEVGTEAGNTRRALLNFSSVNTRLPDFSTVLYAGLQLTAQASSPTGVVDVHRVSRAWTPNAPSWSSYDGVNAWTTAGGDFEPAPLASRSVAASETVLFRLTDLAQRWANGEAQNGLIVKAQSEASAPLLRFDSSETHGSSAPGAPQLTIRYRYGTGALRQYSFDTQELSDRQSVGVNLANVNVLVSASDLSIAGTGLDLEVERFYNAGDTYASPYTQPALGSVGRGWTLSLGPDVGLEVYNWDDGSVAFYGPSGFAVPFPRKADGSFEAPLSGIDAKLNQNPDQTYTLTFNHSGLKYHFNAAGFLTSEEDRNGNDIRYAYNAQNRLTTITDTQDRVVTAAYNAQGLIETLTDSTGRVVRYGYDASKRLTSFTDAAGKVTTYAYGSLDRLIKITDPLLQETRLTYTIGIFGATDRHEVTVTRVTDPSTGAGAKTLYHTCPPNFVECGPDDPRFEGPERRTIVTDPNANLTGFYTDALVRVQKVKDALGRVQSTLQLNDNHDPDWHEGFLQGQQRTSFDYSTEGRFNLRSTKIPTDGDLTEQWRYDDTNHPFLATQQTDPQGKITGYGYDLKGNLESVTNALQRTARTFYNPDGTVKGALDFKGIINPDCPPTPAVSVCHGYDPKGNLTSVNNPAPLGDWSYTYDALSRVDTVTDGKGQVTNYDYDLLDRVDLITYQGGATIDYAYDANGNVLTMADNTGTTGYEYDKLNRLTKETLPGPKVNEYTYDLGSNLTSFTDAGGTVGYVYNGVNNVTQVTEPGASPIVLDYHDDHLRKRISYPNGVSQCFWYDPSDRIEFVWSQRSTDCTKGNPHPKITSYSYEYKHPSTQVDTGLIQKVTDLAGNVTTYTYDDLNRLEQAQTVGPAAKTFAYSYDHNSNRLTETVDGGPATNYAYNDADQLTSGGGISYSYDGNGNEDLTSTGRDFTYNAKDQVSSVIPATGQPAIPMSYTGTGQFRRVTRGSTSFTNSGLGLNREDTTSYTRDPDGLLLGQRNGSRLYFLYDGLGSVVATTTEAGAESAIARYEPFGGCLANCPTGPHRWLGGLGVYFDSATGLYKMGTRYYDPALGRFTQVDPVEGGSANRYDYASQDPINNIDPSGELCVRCLVDRVVGRIFRFTPGELAYMRRMYNEGGAQKLRSTMRTFSRRLNTHLDKLAEAKRTGGFQSSLRTEVRTQRGHIRAGRWILVRIGGNPFRIR